MTEIPEGAPVEPTFDPTETPAPPEPGARAEDAPPEAPAGNPAWAGSPWAQSLEQTFEDPAQREAVHGYLQSEIQPYVTRKEQELGQVGEIWADLNDEEKSVPAYLALAENMYGPEVAQTLADAILQHVQAEGDEPAADGQPDYQEWYDAQPPWIQAQEDTRVAGEEDAAFESEIDQYAPDVREIGAEHLLARYVAVTEGDVQAAKTLFDQEMGPIIAAAQADPALAASLGLNFGASPEAPAAAAAPNVLGSSAAQGTGAPETEPVYESMEDVYSDFYKTVAGKDPGASF